MIWSQWLGRLRAGRDRAAAARRPIPDDLWKRTLVRFPFLRRRSTADAAELRRLTSLFLDRKEFSAAGGLRLTDAIAVSIAAQAVLPVLRLGLRRYDGFVGIVVHPDAVVAHRQAVDDAGVVHAYDEILAGEAVRGGPVMLSWRDVRAAGSGSGTASGYNVVIHEFAHVLAMEDSEGAGVPLLPPDLPRKEWSAVLRSEHARLRAGVEAGDDTALDPYGAESIDEFFAVATESFFVDPTAVQREHPALYDVFARFFKQDPAAETAR